MKTQSAKVDTYGLTDVGKVRSHNEDQFLIASLHKRMALHFTSLSDVSELERLTSPDAFLFLVADGVGGVMGGEVASSTAVQSVARYIAHTTDCYYTFNVDQEHQFMDQLQSSVIECHTALQEEFGTGGRRSKPGPATTLTLVTVMWPRAYIIQVGDSRCYYLRNGKLKQLTQDQTLGREMVDMGVMSETDVQNAGLDNVLSSAIGATIRPALGLIDLEPDDVLLLCTDGLTKHVSDEEICRALDTLENAEQMCRHLVDAALEGGGSDNVTVVVSRVVGNGDTAPAPAPTP